MAVPAVVVRHPEVPLAVGVRYAWSDNPEAANLVNGNGLPHDASALVAVRRHRGGA